MPIGNYFDIWRISTISFNYNLWPFHSIPHLLDSNPEPLHTIQQPFQDHFIQKMAHDHISLYSILWLFPSISFYDRVRTISNPFHDHSIRKIVMTISFMSILWTFHWIAIHIHLTNIECPYREHLIAFENHFTTISRPFQLHFIIVMIISFHNILWSFHCIAIHIRLTNIECPFREHLMEFENDFTTICIFLDDFVTMKIDEYFRSISYQTT